ncbi:MAG: CHASE2 domain-containing protein, partial [Candidatus Pacearchaeota archaeon]
MLKKLLLWKFCTEILWVLTIIFLLFFPDLTAQINFFIEKGYTYIFPDKEPSEEIVLITIGEEDILSLGGWPLKRSYYASLINNLRKYEPTKIGVEIAIRPVGKPPTTPAPTPSPSDGNAPA